MTFARRAAKSGVWLAGFKFVTQFFSWIITISIARILSPGDYGLIAMAGMFTGYIEMFSEMGIGAAIIQKQELTQEEISSIFWFSMSIGIMFAVVGFCLAYPTSWIFHEPRIVLITQSLSVLFIFSALMIVPYNVLVRDLRFKELGLIQLLAVILQSLSMLWMAHRGFGVWVLVNGMIIQKSTNIILTFLASKWKPRLHFKLSEAKPLINFGIKISIARSLYYVFEKSDKFIVGKLFNSQLLGYYSFAIQLASIPNEKIVSIVQQISFPVFSRYQNDYSKCRDIYLKITKYVTLIISPLFIGGIFLGDQIIPVLLGEKWRPITSLFQFFCFTYLITSVTDINGVLHISHGRPHWGMSLTLINIAIMPASLFVAAHYGFNALVIPWVYIYPLICMGWTWITLKKLGISVYDYLKNIMLPVLASIFMIMGIKVAQILLDKMMLTIKDVRLMLVEEILIGTLLYCAYLFLIERKSLTTLWELRKT